MFNILSKTFYLFISPLNWVFILLISLLFIKRQAVKKKVYWLLIAILVVFSNPYLFHKVVLHWQLERPFAIATQHYDAGILLGGMASFDKEHNGYFGMSCDRFTQTVKLYHMGVIKKVVITGGSNNVFRNQPAEADFVYHEMLASGVKPTDIIKENKSINTFENARFSKIKLDSAQLRPPYLLISSAMHLRRATSVFAKAGIAVKPYAAAYEEIDKEMYLDDYFYPRIGLLETWTGVLKEITGLLIYKMTGKA